MPIQDSILLSSSIFSIHVYVNILTCCDLSFHTMIYLLLDGWAAA